MPLPIALFCLLGGGILLAAAFVVLDDVLGRKTVAGKVTVISKREEGVISLRSVGAQKKLPPSQLGILKVKLENGYFSDILVPKDIYNRIQIDQVLNAWWNPGRFTKKPLRTRFIA